MKYVIYCDGGCLNTSDVVTEKGIGSWAYILIKNHHGEDEEVLKKDSAAEVETTNNKMEMTAALKALSYIKENLKLDDEDKIEVFTDSMYLQKGMQKWVKNWKKNGWKKHNGKAVKNKDIWLKLDEFNTEYKITWLWVKGHYGDKYNTECDLMAQERIREALVAIKDA